MKSLFRNQSGQALMETAIVLPLLLVLFLTVMDFGVRMENQARAAMAVRYGAWLGGHGRFDDIQKEINANFFPLLAKKKKGGGGEGGDGVDDYGESGKGGGKNKKKTPWYSFEVKVTKEDLADMFSGECVLKDTLEVVEKILPDGWLGKNNPKVTGTYSQKKIFWEPPELKPKEGGFWDDMGFGAGAGGDGDYGDSPDASDPSGGGNGKTKKKKPYYPFLDAVKNEPVTGYWIDQNDTWDSLSVWSIIHVKT